MAGASEFVFQGKKMFCLSVAGLQLHEKQTVAQLLESAKKEIRQRPLKSVLMITDITNTGYDTEVATMFKEYASHNTPYVKASVVVGASGLQKIILRAIVTLTKRDFHLASTVDEAKEWLANQ